MYNLLSRRYLLTKSKKLIFIKHKYDKKEYIINLLKKNKNLILEDNESYKNIVDEISKSNVDCYTKYINEFCSNRLLVLTKKKKVKCCHHPPCLKWVIDDNYCTTHQDKKYDF